MSRLHDVQDHAAQWILAREEPGWDSVREAEFRAWLNAADLHRVTFLRLQHSWREADRLGSMGRAIEPETLQEETYEPSRLRAARAWMPYAAAAALAVMLGGIWQFSFRDAGPEVRTAEITEVETQIGNQKLIGLPDGSYVQLNTSSAMRATVGKDQREVWLDKGEAYFDVAHDKRRPFIVHAGSRQVTVLGTKFSVRRDGDKVTVMVREGRVRIDDIRASHVVHSTTITGGDIALARGPAVMVTAQTDQRVEDALSWRGGMLSFDQERLSDIAAEFNRYNRRHLIVTDPEVASIRIGGTFPASKPDEFVHLLRDAYRLTIEEEPGTIKISK